MAYYTQLGRCINPHDGRAIHLTRRVRFRTTRLFLLLALRARLGLTVG